MKEFTPYQENILITYRRLLDFHEKLFTRIICVGMSGELKEIQDTFQVGDSYHFEIEQFQDLEDVNVQQLLLLYDRLEEVMNSLANLNGITEEDLDALEVEEDQEEEDFEEDLDDLDLEE